MTEEQRRPGGAEDNMRDELDEAAERGKPGKDASKEAVEEEEQTGPQAASKTTSQTSGTNLKSVKDSPVGAVRDAHVAGVYRSLT